jgi:hypothetical protein
MSYSFFHINFELYLPITAQEYLWYYNFTLLIFLYLYRIIPLKFPLKISKPDDVKAIKCIRLAISD